MLLRYPGGKSRGYLSDMIIEHIESHYQGGVFAEPFFGGGGITIKLLKKDIIESLVIAEADPSLLDLWTVVIGAPDALKRAVKRFTPSVETFVRRKNKILNGGGSGFDALVVNRLAHGGRGVKAGPQGGYEQKGKYKIDCRWNADNLCKTIDEIHDLFRKVPVEVYEDYRVDADYYYLDPPYLGVGDQLYLCNFTESDHYALRDWLRGRNFLLSYNNQECIRTMYSEYKQLVTGTTGNGGNKPNTELLIWSF